MELVGLSSAWTVLSFLPRGILRKEAECGEAGDPDCPEALGSLGDGLLLALGNLPVLLTRF